MSFGLELAGAALSTSKIGKKIEAANNAYNRTIDWINGEGSEQSVFVQSSVEVAQMQHAPGVDAARMKFWDKNAINIAQHRALAPLTDWVIPFGPSEFIGATLDLNATQHFVGTANVDIRPEPSGAVRFTVTNPTSLTSAAKYVTRTLAGC